MKDDYIHRQEEKGKHIFSQAREELNKNKREQGAVWGERVSVESTNLSTTARRDTYRRQEGQIYGAVNRGKTGVLGGDSPR